MKNTAKYNRSEIMKRAIVICQKTGKNWSESQKLAWQEAKEEEPTDDLGDSFWIAVLGEEGFIESKEEERKEKEEKEAAKITFYIECDKWLKKIAECEAIIEDWSSRVYKNSKSKVFVGEELNGDYYSVNYINEKRRENTIRNNEKYIEEYKGYLNNLGYYN